MRVCALCDESLGDGGLHEHLSAKHNISQAQYEKLAAVKLGTMLGKEGSSGNSTTNPNVNTGSDNTQVAAEVIRNDSGAMTAVEAQKGSGAMADAETQDNSVAIEATPVPSENAMKAPEKEKEEPQPSTSSGTQTPARPVAKRMTSEDISKLFDRCVFRCNVCRDVSSHRWNYIRNHLKEKHGYASHQKMAAEDFADHEKLYYIWCKLCSKKLIEDKDKFYYHLYEKHQCLSLEKYFNSSGGTGTRSGPTAKRLLPPPPLQERWPRPRSASPACKRPTPPRKAHEEAAMRVKSQARREQEEPREGYEEEEESVPNPRQKSPSTRAAEDTDSLAGEASAKLDGRVLRYGKLSSLLEKPAGRFSCQICGRILVCISLWEANKHTVDEHGVNLLQYYKMATEEGQRTWQEACLYKCQPCWPAFETTSRKEFEGHLAAEHELGRSRYEEAYGSMTFYTSTLRCLRCDKRVVHDPYSIEEHEKDEACKKVVTDSWLPWLPKAEEKSMLDQYKKLWNMY